MNACTAANAPPATAAVTRPIHQWPNLSAPRAAKNAPESIIPSSPMFTTPLRSENMPPIAATGSGGAHPRLTRQAKPSPRLPDVDDQEVRADEEQDEGLDHQRQVACKLRREDRRIEAARRGPCQQSAEQECRESDADRGIAPEQGDGDSDEADVRHLDVQHAEP